MEHCNVIVHFACCCSCNFCTVSSFRFAMFVVEGQEINDFADWCALSMVFICALCTVFMVVMCTLGIVNYFYVHTVHWRWLSSAHYDLLMAFMCTMHIVHCWRFLCALCALLKIVICTFWNTDCCHIYIVHCTWFFMHIVEFRFLCVHRAQLMVVICTLCNFIGFMCTM